MLARAALLTLALARPAADTADAAALLDAVMAAEQRFLALWRREWLASDRRDRAVGMRSAAIHCHSDGRPPAPQVVIRSALGARSWCPSWTLETRRARPDDGPDDTFDAALDARRRPRVAAARGALLRLLDSAHRVLPTNAFVAGQRVRFRLDDGDADGALAAARDCRGEAAWCDALAGLVLATRGETLAADSAFAAARAAMPDAARCAWDDVGALLPAGDRARYHAIPCAARDSVNARVWWLADPLLGEPGNERRVEHAARRTRLRLRAALPEDERHHWSAADGGDALEEMVVRYGWPTLSVWGGAREDEEHTGWLASHGSGGSAPYVTAEYAPGRPHVVSSLATALAPFAARGDDWELHPPDPARPGRWWPVEHYARRAGALVQLDEGQSALFRRRDAALLAVATRPDARALGAADGDPADAALLLSPRPDSVHAAARARPTLGAPLVLRASIAEPALVGVELRDARGGAARTRFGVEPPPPLSAMRAGEVAVSDALLFVPPEGDASLPADADAAIARMLPTTRLRGVRRLGLYWESYGVAPDDTTDVAVRLERRDGSGGLRRLAERLHLAAERDGAVAVRWREPQPGRGAARRDEGGVPVLGRSLVLDVSALPAGRYWLDVSVARPGGAPAVRRRALVIE